MSIPKSLDFPEFDAWREVPAFDENGAFIEMRQAWLDVGETRVRMQDGAEAVPVYLLPYQCIDKELPVHDAENDKLKFDGTQIMVLKNAVAAEIQAENARLEAEKAALEKAQADAVKAANDAQAQRYADGLKAGFNAAQVTYLMNGYTPPAK